MKGVIILQTMKETHYAPGWNNKALIAIGLFCLTFIIVILIANNIIPIKSENIIKIIEYTNYLTIMEEIYIYR